MPGELGAQIAAEIWGKYPPSPAYHVVVIWGHGSLCASGVDIEPLLYPFEDDPPAEAECCSECLNQLKREAALLDGRRHEDGP